MSITVKTKTTIRALLPPPVRSRISEVIHSRVFGHDQNRFRRFYGKDRNLDNWEQSSARIVFHTHSLEKGLSHDDLRLGFGMSALTNLAAAMRVYANKGFDRSSSQYVNALSTLNEYVRVHRDQGFDTSYLYEIFGGEILQEVAACPSLIGGSMQIEGGDRSSNSQKSFRELVTGRYSIRTFADAPVNQSAIDEAIELSLSSPSVCNRQSARVYVITDPAVIADSLTAQGGFTGYPAPPALLAVTSDISGFLSLTERNQPYIDGGIFSMTLLLALESVGLAACPLNAMFSVATEHRIRTIIDIGESENIIMFMAVGNPKAQNNVAKSFRYSREDITRYR